MRAPPADHAVGRRGAHRRGGRGQAPRVRLPAAPLHLAARRRGADLRVPRALPRVPAEARPVDVRGRGARRLPPAGRGARGSAGRGGRGRGRVRAVPRRRRLGERGAGRARRLARAARAGTVPVDARAHRRAAGARARGRAVARVLGGRRAGERRPARRAREPRARLQRLRRARRHRGADPGGRGGDRLALPRVGRLAPGRPLDRGDGEAARAQPRVREPGGRGARALEPRDRPRLPPAGPSAAAGDLRPADGAPRRGARQEPAGRDGDAPPRRPQQGGRLRAVAADRRAHPRGDGRPGGAPAHQHLVPGVAREPLLLPGAARRLRARPRRGARHRGSATGSRSSCR